MCTYANLLVLEARAVISPDLEVDISLSVLGSEELHMGEGGNFSIDLPPQSVACEELVYWITWTTGLS